MNSNNLFRSHLYTSKLRIWFSLHALLNIYWHLIFPVLLLWSYSVLWSPTLLQTVIFFSINNLFVTITWPPPSFHLLFWLICDSVKQHRYQSRTTCERFLCFKSWLFSPYFLYVTEFLSMWNVSFYSDSLMSLRGFDERLCKMLFENQSRLHQLNVSCQYAYQLVQWISLDFWDVKDRKSVV